jgi:hypothetical protein
VKTHNTEGKEEEKAFEMMMSSGKTTFLLLVLAVIGAAVVDAATEDPGMAMGGIANRKLLFVPAWPQPATGLEAFTSNIGNFLTSVQGQVAGALQPITGACY